ncbi:MAG: DUF402 domain-containing protein [Actinomycetia bacterium]|nr:DUF402 domain-containing protein [Actinomycetes bacterium]
MWSFGEIVTRRENLGLFPIPRPAPYPRWHRRSWLELPVHVVEDGPDQLVTYIASGARFGFPEIEEGWPSSGGIHPWQAQSAWHGHGCLMVQQAGEHHAIWHFWDGPERQFSNWYINLQTAFERTDHGYDTLDLELDFVAYPDGRWEIKDAELLQARADEGRFWPGLVDWIEEQAHWYIEHLDTGELWWDTAWADWEPPDGWDTPG